MTEKITPQKEIAPKDPAPKISNAVIKAGKSLLKNNSSISVVYMTSDGYGFAEKNDANNHAKTLKNKTITPIKNN